MTKRRFPLQLVFALVAFLSLVAAACGDSDGDSASGAGVTTSDDGESGEEAADDEASEGEAAGDSGGDPVNVSPEQVASTPVEDTVSALQESEDPSFPDPLIDIADITSGGPPPDGIPPIDDPNFYAVDDVSFLADEEPILRLEVEGEVRGYPVQIMTWHEIVNDTVGGVPVTVTYCPLCNSAVGFDRRFGDRILDFGTSGLLFNSSLVMYDRQTSSLWTHFNGEAVVGTLAGAQLEFLPVSTVSWSEFREAHPDALVLNRDTGEQRNYGVNPYAGYDTGGGPDFFFDEVDPRLPERAQVLGVRDVEKGTAVALPISELEVTGVDQFVFEDRSIVAWHQFGLNSALDTAAIDAGRDIGQTGVFSANVDGQVLTFSTIDGGFTDGETGSTWNVLGQATAGELEGTQLEAIEHLNTFWFAWAAFNENTEIRPAP